MTHVHVCMHHWLSKRSPSPSKLRRVTMPHLALHNGFPESIWLIQLLLQCSSSKAEGSPKSNNPNFAAELSIGHGPKKKRNRFVFLTSHWLYLVLTGHRYQRTTKRGISKQCHRQSRSLDWRDFCEGNHEIHSINFWFLAVFYSWWSDAYTNSRADILASVH